MRIGLPDIAYMVMKPARQLRFSVLIMTNDNVITVSYMTYTKDDDLQGEKNTTCTQNTHFSSFAKMILLSLTCMLCDNQCFALIEYLSVQLSLSKRWSFAKRHLKVPGTST